MVSTGIHEFAGQFRQAISDAGLCAPETVEADGVLHRFSSNGKRNDTAGWYVLFSDPVPAGVFGCWRLGINQTWKADVSRKFTQEEKSVFRKRMEEARSKAEAERVARQGEARKTAGWIWKRTAEASPEHPYLKSRGISGHGIRQRGDRLIIPVLEDDVFHSLQIISPDGTKRFLPGGRISGCYFSIGHAEGDLPLCIAEGFATGASIHEATAYPVFIAFNAGNLLSVAGKIRERFPNRKIILCADDDYRNCDRNGKLFNTGITSATEAAGSIGGYLCVPDFGRNRPEGATDFNDLQRFSGPEAVKKCFAQIRPVQPDEYRKKTDQRKGENTRRQFGDGYFELTDNGVLFVTENREGDEIKKWICSPLSILAETRDSSSNEWGRLLEWKDRDGICHRWAMPTELLQGDGLAMRQELARQGLIMAPDKRSRDLLACYIQIWKVGKRARCVDRPGWHGDVYVLPSCAIGQKDEIVVFQNSGGLEPAFSQSGSSDDWKTHVAALAQGNSRMVFAICTAFASTMADIAGMESGGFHFRGSSSSGKTTALHLAASVFGDPSRYIRLWRSTTNGLEGLASLHNDGLLILDELSQIDPKEAGDAAYLLANGQGKTRASRNGMARKPASWRLLFLSAGEENLTAIMNRAGKRSNAGQEIRLADIDSDAGQNMGVFETLHHYSTPAELALALKDNAGRFYGETGTGWIKQVVSMREQIPQILKAMIDQFVNRHVPKEASGQIFRVARRFALVAVAGELATGFGLTGWIDGEAADAAGKCFDSWLDGFGGTGNREERAILEQVKGFIEQHGASRFEDISAIEEQRVINRVGYFRNNRAGEREYLILPEAYRTEVCRGFDARTVSNVLLKHGWLKAGSDGKAQVAERIPSLGKVARVYVLTSRIWDEAG